MASNVDTLFEFVVIQKGGRCYRHSDGKLSFTENIFSISWAALRPYTAPASKLRPQNSGVLTVIEMVSA